MNKTLPLSPLIQPLSPLYLVASGHGNSKFHFSAAEGGALCNTARALNPATKSDRPERLNNICVSCMRKAVEGIDYINSINCTICGSVWLHHPSCPNHDIEK